MAKKPNRHRKTDWRRVPRTGRVASMEIRSVSESPTMEKLLKQHHARDVSASTLQQLAGGGFAQIINCSGRAHICGNEAACLQDNDSTSRCICPHDLSPPTLDLKCPNRNTVSMTPKPIPNIMPPTTLPGTEQIEAVETRLPEVMVIVIGCAFVLTMLIGVVLYYFKRRNFDTKSTSSDLEASPMNLKESLLLANKYAPNPQYFSCAFQDVPVLQRNSLVFIKDIGEGFFGKVYKGELIRDDKTEVVAIKVLKVTANKEAEEDFMREVETMSSFRHENILSLLGVVGRDDSNGPWMIFEYMPFGDLAEVLRANAPSFRAHIPGLQPLTKDSLLWITTQIASGMAYLAAQRFVHRDLACRNCLVGEDLVVKIADFGMTRDVYTCDYYRIGGSRMLPVRWMSPESVVYGRFTLESDIYSFGVLLWEVYTFGKQPYFGHSNEEAVQLIMDGVLLVPPDDCPSFVCQLMRDCWRESRERPAFAEILERLQKADKFEGSASNGCRIATLPRPPPGLVTVRTPDVLDADGYLLPSPVATREYIQAVPA